MSNQNNEVFSIQVTKNLISIGIPKCNWACPIALAIEEQHETLSVDVNGLYFRVRTETHVKWGKLSERAGRFIRAFDKGLPVSPKQFRLTATNVKEIPKTNNNLLIHP